MTTIKRTGQLGSMSLLARVCTLVFLVSATFRGASVGPSVCLGESTSNSKNTGECYPRWPSSNWQNACPIKWCYFPKNDSTVAVDDQVKCTNLSAKRDYRLGLRLALSNPDCGPAPGPPKNIAVKENTLTLFSYWISVKWNDPVDAPGLIGYDIELHKLPMRKHTISDRRIRQLLKKSPFARFSVSKNFSGAGLAAGSNEVSIDTAPIHGSTKGSVLQMTDTELRALFNKNFFTSRIFMKIISLPVRSKASVTEQSDFVELEVSDCDNDRNQCFKDASRWVSSSAGCIPDSLKVYKNTPICDCYLYDVFNFVSLTYANDSVTFSWAWGEDAPNDALVRVYFLLSNSNSAPIAGLYLNNSDSARSRTVYLTSMVPGMRITIKAHRVIEETWYGNRTLSIVIPNPEITTAPPPPSPRSTSTMPSSIPEDIATTKMSNNISFFATISVATLLVILLLLVLVLALIMRLYPEALTSCPSILWPRRIRAKRIDSGRVPPQPDPCPLSNVDSESSKPRVYISYSRFSDTSKENARHLRTLLAQNGVEPILDDDYRNEMADDEPRWVMEEIEAATCVIILLDEAYPWVLGSNAVLQLLSLDDGSSTSLAKQESDLLQNHVYWGKPGFIVPVFVGPESRLQSCLPSILRCHTIHRLPLDFNNMRGSVSKIVANLKRTGATQQV